MMTPSPTASPPPQRSLWRLVARLLWAAIDLYLVGMIVMLALYLLTGDRLWPVAVAAIFGNWLLLPVFVVVGLSLWRRRWRSLLPSLVGAAVFLLWFGGLFLPGAPTAPDDALTLRLMQFNVYGGGVSPRSLIPTLRDSDADIISLVELDYRSSRAIAADLSEEYPYQALYPQGIPGKGLLSRYPILDHEAFYLQADAHLHLRATLDVNGTPLTVLVTHPPRPVFGLRSGIYFDIIPEAADEIATMTELAVENGPAILMGDFNTTQLNSYYNIPAQAGLIDVYREVGWGFGATWPARRVRFIWVPPLLRIDYIWTTPDFTPLSAWVGPNIGSDHFPVLAEVAWTENGPAPVGAETAGGG